MLKLTLAGLLFVVGSVQAETYVFCTDEADGVVTLQDGEYISNDEMESRMNALKQRATRGAL